MMDLWRGRVWTYRVLFVLLCLAWLVSRLLPLGIGADRLPGPDLMLAFTLAWVVRRPDYLPALLVALAFLVADLLLSRPPGLRSLAALLATEFLRQQVVLIRDRTFAYEIVLISGTLVAMALAERVIMLFAFGDPPPFGAFLAETAITVIIYPVVVLFSNHVFGVRKVEVRETSLGGRGA